MVQGSSARIKEGDEVLLLDVPLATVYFRRVADEALSDPRRQLLSPTALLAPASRRQRWPNQRRSGQADWSAVPSHEGRVCARPNHIP